MKGKVVRIDQVPKEIGKQFDLVVDRIIVKHSDEDFLNRLGNAVDNAFFEGKGRCIIEELDTGNHATGNSASRFRTVVYPKRF